MFDCIICKENSSTGYDVSPCKEDACKITYTLFTWKQKVFDDCKPPKNTSRSGRGGVDVKGPNKGRSYTWFYYNHSRKKINFKLKEVRAKLYLLDKMKSYDEIIKSLNTNYCNQIKYSIKVTSYEKQHSTFNTL